MKKYTDRRLDEFQFLDGAIKRRAWFAGY